MERESGAVLADVLDGKVSPEAAGEVYGVVMAAGDQVDKPATKNLRETLRARRGLVAWTFDQGPDGTSR